MASFVNSWYSNRSETRLYNFHTPSCFQKQYWKCLSWRYAKQLVLRCIYLYKLVHVKLYYQYVLYWTQNHPLRDRGQYSTGLVGRCSKFLVFVWLTFGSFVNEFFCFGIFSFFSCWYWGEMNNNVKFYIHGKHLNGRLQNVKKIPILGVSINVTGWR